MMYTFKVVVEPDEGGWHAYCPALKSRGAVTQGPTYDEALKNINEVVQMIVDEMTEEGSEIASGQSNTSTHTCILQIG
ncbi:MAG: type II toxin-antitoxin system HicB family antitoxin [Acidobacteriia bacterium]|nr:type II toxin-antitoxin system HicB family antitoxin [Terriglobia bacterium]